MRRLSLIAISLAAVFPLAAWGQENAEPGPSVKPAKLLHASMATLRIYCAGKDEAAAGKAGESATREDPAKPPTATVEDRPQDDKDSEHPSTKDCRRPCSVIVCSGVCVAANKVVTAVPVSSDSKIRLTFPGGKQDHARLRVIDEFSGLVLLDSPNCPARPLEMSADVPEAGSWVMTAAAWGVEKPLVFEGMVSGTGHTLAGLCYPPLLVCQLPPTSTSTGSAIVNREGKLVGVVVGADPADMHRGWMTYAVPASHVRRLLRASEESDKQGHKESVIVLKRRRPQVGWKLESEGDEIVVKRLTTGGPAEKAGIQKGDRILAVDGIRIRSIYQAWAPTMCKQAGDTLIYRVQRGDQTQDLVVVLGGGVEVESLPADKLSEIVQPKVEFGRDEKGGYYFKPYRSLPGQAREARSAGPDRLDQLERENQSLKAQLLKAEEEALKARSALQKKSP